MEVKSLLLILIIVGIIMISGCIREGEPCKDEGQTVKDDTGSSFECKDGKWSRIQVPATKDANKSLEKGITDDYYSKFYGNSTPIPTQSTYSPIVQPTITQPTVTETVQSEFGNGSKFKSSPSPIKTPSPSPSPSPTPSLSTKKYCGNNITEPELGEVCDPPGINMNQCPRPKYSGTCDNCKQCIPVPSSVINLSATLGLVGPYTSADLVITLKDWNANKDPYWYDNATFQLYYTTGSYNDPCAPTLVMYKQISNIKESGVNSGEWKAIEKWQSSDAVIKYTGSDGQQHTTSAGAYTPPQGC